MSYPTSLQQTRDSIGSESGVYPIPLRLNKRLNIYKTSVSLKNQIEDGILYWDSDVQGTWDDFNWDDNTTPDIFVNDNIQSVINQNNIFYDTLDTNDFINDSSTGTYVQPSALVDGSYQIEYGETFQTKIIAKDDNVYTKIIGELEGTNIDKASSIQISLDGGYTYNDLTEDITNNYSNSSKNGILLKVEYDPLWYQTELVYALDETDSISTIDDKTPNANDGTPIGFTVNNGTDTNVGYNNFYRYTSSAYYPFQGNANDESLNSNDGIVTGATLTTDRFGNAYSAYEFSDGDYINLGTASYNLGTNSFTFFGMCKVTGFSAGSEGSGEDLIGCSSSGTRSRVGLTMEKYSDSWRPETFMIDDSGVGSQINGSKLNFNQEYFLCMVVDRNNDKVYLYVDGIIDSNFIGGIDISSLTDNINPQGIWGIFKQSHGSGISCYGTADEVGILPYALTSTQVSELDTILQSQKLIDYEDESGAVSNGTGYIYHDTINVGTSYSLMIKFKTSKKPTGNMSLAGFNKNLPYSSSHEKEFYLDSDGHLHFRGFDTTTREATSNINYADGEEHTCTVVWINNTKLAIYVDGVFIGQRTDVTTSYTGYSTPILTIMNSSLTTPLADLLTGSVSLFRFWNNKALSDAEVLAEHNSPHYPVTGEGLVFATDFTRGNSNDINHLVDMGDGSVENQDIGWNFGDTEVRRIDTGVMSTVIEGDHTLYCKVKIPSGSTGNRAILGAGGSLGETWLLQANSTSIQYWEDTSSTTNNFSISNTGIVEIVQRYVAATKQSNIYVNGVLVNQVNWGGTQQPTNRIFIGDRYLLGRNFLGQIKRPIILNRALSDGDVAVGQTATGEVAELFANPDSYNYSSDVIDITDYKLKYS